MKTWNNISGIRGGLSDIWPGLPFLGIYIYPRQSTVTFVWLLIDVTLMAIHPSNAVAIPLDSPYGLYSKTIEIWMAKRALETRVQIMLPYVCVFFLPTVVNGANTTITVREKDGPFSHSPSLLSTGCSPPVNSLNIEIRFWFVFFWQRSDKKANETWKSLAVPVRMWRNHVTVGYFHKVTPKKKDKRQDAWQCHQTATRVKPQIIPYASPQKKEKT